MVSKNLEQWLRGNEKVNSPYIFRSAAAIKENVAWRLESTIRIMISITAVEYPRTRPASIRIPILVKVHELVEGAKIHRPARQIFTFILDLNFSQLNHYIKYRFLSRDFVSLTFPLQYLERKIFVIVSVELKSFWNQSKYFLLFHAKNRKISRYDFSYLRSQRIFKIQETHSREQPWEKNIKISAC